MIDRIIRWISENITTVLLPSTLLKYLLAGIIVASLLSFVVGYGVIIVALVASNIVWLTSEYLYAKQVEDAESEEDDEFN